jgi:hypothetical protein
VAGLVQITHSRHDKGISGLAVEEFSRGQEAQIGGMTAWENASGFFHGQQEAEDYIEATLVARFGVSPFFLMNLTQDQDTWAAVFITDDTYGRELAELTAASWRAT